MSESTTNLLQVIFAGLTFLVFIGIFIITYLYAQATKRMADIMSKEFELRYRPFVDIRVGLPHMISDYSGFRIPLEILLLGEFPFTLTKTELEIEVFINEKKEILKLIEKLDKTLTRKEQTIKLCIGPFQHEKILHCMEARFKNSNLSAPQITGLYIYHRTVEGKEELFQRLPVPYRNYYELDKICEI